ncbi:MAG: TlpA family protein disulfide reductase [Candidatus Flexifilum sp.]|jgi:peroxiredoxin
MMFKARAAFIIVGILFWAAALQLIAMIGLPDRAEQTALVIDGQSFAPEIGSLAPPFSAYDVDGDRIALFDYRGRIVLLNFWATWCEPCRFELPELQAAVQEQESRVLIAVSSGDSAATIDAWLRANRIARSERVTFIADDTDQIARIYAVRGRPTTLIIAPDGRIAHISYGMMSRADLEAVLARIQHTP